MPEIHEKRTRIYCCACQKRVKARLTDGFEVYPHREDLAMLPFWKCDTCGNFVGCHHKTQDRTNPVGVIATPEIKRMRMAIHGVLDPLWKEKLIKRPKLYAMLAKALGKKEYHTADIRSLEEAKKVFALAKRMESEIRSEPKGAF